MAKLSVQDIVRKDTKALKTAQANARYKNTVFAPKAAAKKAVLKSATSAAAKSGLNKTAGGVLTRVASKVAVPLAVGYEAYNTGKKIGEFVKGIKSFNKESDDWAKQSMAQGDQTLAVLRERRKKKLAQTK